MQQADIYAKKKKKELEGFINNLYNSQKQSQLAQEANFKLANDQVVSSLNNQIPVINQNALDNSRQAFVNKMLGGKAVSQNLSQAGLSTTGTVGTAHAQVENQYGKNLNDILVNKSNQLQNIENQKSNAGLEYAKNLANLKAQSEANNISINQYVQGLQQNAYNDAYNRFIENAKYQDSIRQYQDQLKQQQWENDYKNRVLKADSTGLFGFEKNSTKSKNNISTFHVDKKSLSKNGKFINDHIKQTLSYSKDANKNKKIATIVKQNLDKNLITELDAEIILREYGLWE